MLRARGFLISLFSASCFSSPVTLDSASSSGATPDPVMDCRACQATQCTAYAQTCSGDPDCETCVDAPIALDCLTAVDSFRALAFCSCENCPAECSYMCPGGGDACRNCTESICQSERQTCLTDPSAECTPCVQDPFIGGCQDLPDYQALNACECDGCGASCVWQCRATAGQCAGCLTGPCSAPFNACLSDEACEVCFSNNALAGCDQNALLGELAACSCEMCTGVCGQLFACG